MRIRFHCALMLLIAFPLLYAETIDRIVATVNGHPVMESELTEQLHLEQFFDGKAPRVVSISEQRAALERLLDQMLLQQQMDAANFAKPTPEEISQRLQDLRRQIAPNQGDGAWQGALSSYGLTENDVAEHVAIELRTLHFIDARFRPAVRVEPGSVEAYYREQLVPKMTQAGAALPPFKQVEPRIREILVQKQVDELLEGWLKALRTQTEIRFPTPASSVEASQAATRAQAAEVR